MSSENRTEGIEVTILGQKYTVRGDGPEERTRTLAAYVDERLRDVCKALPGVTPLKAAIIASLNISDELFRLREDHERTARTIEEKTNVLTGLFD